MIKLFRYRDALFLLIVACLLGVATWYTAYLLQKQFDSADLINQAGKQRMRVQRVTLLASRVTTLPAAVKSDSVVHEIGQLLTEFQSVHDRLRRELHFRDGLSDDSAHFLLEQRFKQRVSEFLHLGRTFVETRDSEHSKGLLKFADGELASMLDMHVLFAQRHLEEKLGQLRLLLLIGGGVLILSIIILFRVFYRRSVAALLEQAAQIRSIYNSSADGIITISTDGIITSVNPAAQKIFAFKAREMLGHDVSMLLPIHERDEHRLYVQESKLTSSRIINRTRDLTGRRKDGSLFPLELTVARLSEESKEAGFVGIFRDVTDRIEIQNELNNEFERTKLARYEAEKASKAKSEFLSSMSHELRTPLNAILGFGQLLATDKRNPLTDKQKMWAEYIVNSGNQLLALIEQVLDLAKIESGKVKMDLQETDSNEVVLQAVDMASMVAEKYDVAIVNECGSDDLPTVVADQMRFRQVLLNFLSNGIKYNRKGGKVFLRCEAIDGFYLRFLVSDTGLGIAGDHLQNLFQPFHRLGAEHSSVEGTGIGLVITKELVQGMHGHLGFETQEGEGSTFWFELPLKDQADRARKPLIKRTNETRLYTPSSPCKCLLIEDNPVDADMLRLLSEDMQQLIIKHEADAESGLRSAKTWAPDLILMDINLPGLDGYDALAQLAAWDETASIPVVAVSSFSSEKEKTRVLQAGFRHYLNKPLSKEEVRAFLMTVLASGEGWAGAKAEQSLIS